MVFEPACERWREGGEEPHLEVKRNCEHESLKERRAETVAQNHGQEKSEEAMTRDSLLWMCPSFEPLYQAGDESQNFVWDQPSWCCP